MKFSVRRQLALASVALLVTLLLGLMWFWCDLFPGDESDLATRPSTPSANLDADLKLMWATKERRSTEEAIPAAERVFATVELIGRTRSNVIALLGDPRASSDSRYNFPFYPACRNDLVYRFDTGVGGCQYNVKFGWTGRVRRVQYLGIE